MAFIVPILKPLPEDAARETAERMLAEYEDEMVRLNPRWFLPLGVNRRWWHFFSVKIEHPHTCTSEGR